MILCALTGPLSVLAADRNIAEVEIDGNERVDSAAILQLLKVETPGKVKDTTVSEDVGTLYKTGFFEQVLATVRSGSKGDVLIYRVIEKPQVRKVFVQGNENVSKGDLTEQLTFEGNRFYDNGRALILIRRAKALYQSQGYYDASIESSIVPVSGNQIDVTFSVSEGKRYKITDVRVEGLDEVDEDDLLEVVQTTDYKWWSSWLFGTGRLNNEMLENDRALMRQYFFDNGYLDASVGEAVVRKEDGGLVVTFPAEEGNQYEIRTLSVAGDLINESESETLDGIETETGDVFNASQLREDSFAISRKFTDTGFAFANVSPETEIDKKNRLVDVRFNVEKGKPVYIRRIDVTGNDKTYDNVIRREMAIGETELFSSTKVERSQALLQRLGFFEEVNVSTEPTGKDDQVDLKVNVREGSTGTFSVGAGYSTADGVLFNARLSENNLFGTGRQASINADLGAQRDSIILSLDDRRINDSLFAGGIDLLKTEQEFIDFDREQVGGGVTFGYPLEEALGETFEDIRGSIRYQYLDIDITNVEDTAASLVQESEGNTTASLITPRLTRNTINNPLNPTNGSQQVLSVELAGLGGSEEYYLFEARNRMFYPLFDTSFGSFVFSWRTRFAYGETFDDDPFPLFRRFFPGGINSVRGFEIRTLGPKDANGNEFGGSKQLVNNLEIIFPLVQSAGLRGVIFYDLGEAFDDDQSIDFGELRQAYGYGLRWTSPLGPIRIEFGFPIDRETGEDSMVTLFSFGAPI